MAEFLDSRDTATSEAAMMALGRSRLAEAFDLLKSFGHKHPIGSNDTVYMAMAMLRLPAANEFLLDIVATGPERNACIRPFGALDLSLRLESSGAHHSMRCRRAAGHHCELASSTTPSPVTDSPHVTHRWPKACPMLLFGTRACGLIPSMQSNVRRVRSRFV